MEAKFRSVVPGNIFVPLNWYGYPNSEPKCFRTRFIKGLRSDWEVNLHQSRYSKFQKMFQTRPPDVVRALQFHLNTFLGISKKTHGCELEGVSLPLGNYLVTTY